MPAKNAPPELLSRGDVAALLRVRPRDLAWWIYALREDRRYSKFEIEKRSGSRRRIRAPIKPIKDMQRTLAEVLVGCYEPPPTVHGFTPGRSPLSNARAHLRQPWLLRFDLEDFFPSINFGRVRGLFMAYPFHYPPDVATTLAQLCCFQNELPQGAPTSPIISNFICRGMDRDLGRLAQAERCFYTRYADDVCFSTDRSVFPTSLAEPLPDGTIAPGPAINRIIRTHGFRVNDEKTRLVRRTQRQRVTGLVVNEIPNVPRDYIRSLRSLLYIWERYGEQAAAEAFQRAHPTVNWPPGKAAPEFRRVVGGRVQYVGSVKGWSSPVYRGLAVRLREQDASFDPRTLRTLHEPQAVRLYVEGPTDVEHLQAAIRHLQRQGDFLALDARWASDSSTGGDAALLRMCQGLALTQQAIPCICIFDRDRPATLAEAVGTSNFKQYGNRVAAIAIVPPPWLGAGDKACIEFLYRPQDLELRDQQGRRLYLAHEFDRRSGRHLTEPVSTPNPQSDALVRDEVYRFSDGVSVGLSKSAFASYVNTQTPPFDTVSFEGFRSTLELLEVAVARVL